MHKPMLIATVALGTLLAAAPVLAQDNVVNVYNWSDYIAEDTIANFEAETGIKVNYDVYDNNEIVDAKLLAGNSGYDIVVPSGNFLERQIKAGLILPLDKSLLTNLGNFVNRALAFVDKTFEGVVPAIVSMLNCRDAPLMVVKELTDVELQLIASVDREVC